MEGLGINLNFLLSQIVNFLILFVALYFLLWKRVLNMLDARKQRIQEGLEKAEQAGEELARAQAAYAEKVAEGETEAKRIRAEAQKIADQARAKALDEAQVQAEAILADAREQADLERRRMLKDLRGQVGELVSGLPVEALNWRAIPPSVPPACGGEERGGWHARGAGPDRARALGHLARHRSHCPAPGAHANHLSIVDGWSARPFTPLVRTIDMTSAIHTKEV